MKKANYLVLHHPLEPRQVVAVVEERRLGDLAVCESHLLQDDVHPLLHAAVRHHLRQKIHLLLLSRHERRHHEVTVRVLDEPK